MNGQSQPDHEQVAEEVRTLVRTAGDRGISGSQLGLLLRAKWPSFSPAKLGVATLREFIRGHITGVRELGRAGGDVVYGPADLTLKRQEADTSTDDLWRIWISPLSPFGIAIDPNTGKTRSITLGESTEGQLQIGPVPIEKHRQIASEFLDSRTEALDDNARARLAEILKDSDSRWWTRWNDVLRSISPQITRNWFMFREQSLLGALREALKAGGLNEEVQAEAFESVIESRQRLRSKVRRPELAEIESQSGTKSSHEELVELVQRVAARLREEELRAMSLPLGLVLDCLREKPKR